MASHNPGVDDDQGGSSHAGERDRGSSSEGPTIKRLRSCQSLKHAFARFRNASNERRAKVVWINFNGNRVVYRDILPCLFVDVNTFEGHPWVFEDADTGDRLMALGQEVFYPRPYDRSKEAWPPERQSVKIHIPVYTLQERCLQVIRDAMSPEELDRSNAPSLLRGEIQQAVDRKRHYIDTNPS